MASVYLARDLRHGRSVAVKVLRPDLGNTLGPERFLREIRTTAQLVHPHILPLFDSGQVDELLYYIMPHVSGETLADRLAREKRLPVDQAVPIARQVADALAYAHGRRVVHRDLKPSNVLLFEGGQASLADFGLAAAITAARSDRLTATGIAVGSPLYMSPEQIEGTAEVDGRADVYGLGCTLFEMLAGQPPFKAPTMQAVLLRHLTVQPPSIRALRPEVPKELQAAVAQALEKDREKRIDAEELCAMLDAVGPVVELSVASLARARLKAPPRVLVLPFAEASGESSSDMIGIALADEIITGLSNLGSLRVIARSSALVELRGTSKSLRRLADELDVQFVVEGSVQRSGEMLRISAKIARAEDEEILWAQAFTGSASDLFEIEETIARGVAEAMRVQVSPSEARLLAARPIPDVRAYEYYLRAKQQVLMFTGEALDNALVYLQKGAALLGEENPHILAATGYVYWQFYNAGIRPDPAYLEKARECGELLRELAPDLPDGHRLLGLVTTQLTGDSRMAVAHLRAALERNPYDTDSLLWLGVLYGFVGRSSSGFPLVERLLEVDPLPSIYHVMPGVLTLLDGDFSRAVPMLRAAHELDPQNPIGTLFYAQALAMAGDVYASREAFAQLEEGPSTFFAALASVYRAALAGDRSATEAAITEEVGGASRMDFQYSWSLAQCLAMVGAKKAALGWLSNAVVQGFINYPFLSERDPLLASLRSMPEFAELVSEVRESWMHLESAASLPVAVRGSVGSYN